MVQDGHLRRGRVAVACRAALGREPASVLAGVPADDLSPREQWRALTAWFGRKRSVRVA